MCPFIVGPPLSPVVVSVLLYFHGRDMSGTRIAGLSRASSHQQSAVTVPAAPDDTLVNTSLWRPADNGTRKKNGLILPDFGHPNSVAVVCATPSTVHEIVPAAVVSMHSNRTPTWPPPKF